MPGGHRDDGDAHGRGRRSQHRPPEQRPPRLVGEEHGERGRRG